MRTRAPQYDQKKYLSEVSILISRTCTSRRTATPCQRVTRLTVAAAHGNARADFLFEDKLAQFVCLVLWIERHGQLRGWRADSKVVDPKILVSPKRRRRPTPGRRVIARGTGLVFLRFNGERGSNCWERRFCGRTRRLARFGSARAHASRSRVSRSGREAPSSAILWRKRRWANSLNPAAASPMDLAKSHADRFLPDSCDSRRRRRSLGPCVIANRAHTRFSNDSPAFTKTCGLDGCRYRKFDLYDRAHGIRYVGAAWLSG